MAKTFITSKGSERFSFADVATIHTASDVSGTHIVYVYRVGNMHDEPSYQLRGHDADRFLAEYDAWAGHTIQPTYPAISDNDGLALAVGRAFLENDSANASALLMMNFANTLETGGFADAAADYRAIADAIDTYNESKEN